MERRPRRTKKEKMEEELLKTEEAIRQYQAAIVTMEKKKGELLEAIELEGIREVTKLMKKENLSLDELQELIGKRNDQKTADQEKRGA